MSPCFAVAAQRRAKRHYNNLIINAAIFNCRINNKLFSRLFQHNFLKKTAVIKKVSIFNIFLLHSDAALWYYT